MIDGPATRLPNPSRGVRSRTAEEREPFDRAHRTSFSVGSWSRVDYLKALGIRRAFGMDTSSFSSELRLSASTAAAPASGVC